MDSVEQKLRGRKTVEDRVTEFGPVVEQRWRPYFQRAELSYPPSRLLLLGLKEEKELWVYAANETGSRKLLRKFPILAASGNSGPKLREGDRQVPEGVYRVESLNPNSQYHLALRVNYPNEFDRTRAATEGRENLGGDIMIHGKQVSIGCLAMGDEAAEDLFILAGLNWPQEIPILLCPRDFRAKPLPAEPSWMRPVYKDLEKQLRDLPTQAS